MFFSPQNYRNLFDLRRKDIIQSSSPNFEVKEKNYKKDGINVRGYVRT